VKKLLWAFIASVIVFASAGESSARDSYFGFKGGVNIADVTGDDFDLSSSNRFIGGLFYGIDYTDDFGLRIEGLYVQKGAEGTFVLPPSDHEHEFVVRLDYIEVPVYFVVGFPTGESFAVNLYAGPTFGFNVKAEAENVDHEETVELDAEAFEFGAAFGGGAEYLMSSFSIVADVRYALGATSVTDNIDGKNTGLGIMLGVKFPVGE
jgi:hypothetical protein